MAFQSDMPIEAVARLVLFVVENALGPKLSSCLKFRAVPQQRGGASWGRAYHLEQVKGGIIHTLVQPIPFRPASGVPVMSRAVQFFANSDDAVRCSATAAKIGSGSADAEATVGSASAGTDAAPARMARRLRFACDMTSSPCVVDAHTPRREAAQTRAIWGIGHGALVTQCAVASPGASFLAARRGA